MLKKLFNLIKRIVISAFILYGYNLLVTPINLIIPINIITVTLLTIFGLPALFSLIIILIVVF
ncbi:MAG TPA: pro-sigmaK processing inhibitor BofA family protein [Candidatus Faecisoma merdavium]|nr:pro-sigmaK processing inhibitor BofA family protein [Candidatus Faecisoma merdavium]